MESGINEWPDFLVIAVYFAVILAVGIWAVVRSNRGSVKGYFLASRDMIWLPVGASLFASNIGSEHFIGLAGSGAASGIAVVLYEWMSMPLAMLLSWAFLPVYISAGVYTLPEYIQKRFGGQRLRIYLSCLALTLYIMTKIAVTILAGALFIQTALGWDMYVSILALLAVTCAYTVLGGLVAVMYTDTIQTFIMVAGAVALTVISFNEIGGFDALEPMYMSAVPGNQGNTTHCGVPRSDSFNVFRHPVDSDNPWPGLLLQASLGCVWYWCADQVMVQRVLAARNLSHAKAGSILCGYLKLLPLYLIIFPGMISRALYPDEIACVTAEECYEYCENEVGCSNIAYPKLVMELMPVGLRGLLLAVMMSAIMSSLTSTFNSASTLFTMDLWRKYRPAAPERELIIVGRVCVMILCCVSILWVPLIQTSAGGQIFVYIQAIQGYLGTPVGAMFLVAVFWSKTNEQGAFWGLLCGHVCGVIRMILDFVYTEPRCGTLDTRPAIVADLHYTYFSQANMLLTVIIIMTVSVCTERENHHEAVGLTWWTLKKTTKLELQDIEPLHGGSGTGTQTDSPPEPDPAVPAIVDNTHSTAQLTKHHSSSDHGSERLSKSESSCRYYLCRLCGISSTTRSSTDPEELIDDSEEDKSRMLRQHPVWRDVINVNAILALVVMGFLCGVYK